MTPANLHVRESGKQCKGHTAVLTRQNDVYNYACVCLCLSELLLGVSPRSGMCVPGRVVARSFSTLRLVCSLGELLLGGSPRSGMCALG